MKTAGDGGFDMTRRKKYLCILSVCFCAFLFLCETSFRIYTDAVITNPGAQQTNGIDNFSSVGENQGVDSEKAAAKKAADDAAARKAADDAAAKKAADDAAAKKAAEEAAAKEVQTKPVSGNSSTDLSSQFPSSSEVVSEASSSSGVLLPSVGSISEVDPLASATENRVLSKRMNLYGILAWACIILGIVVILTVVLSNRFPPRGSGRSRYHRGKRRSKHLLSDKYYHHINRY